MLLGGRGRSNVRAQRRDDEAGEVMKPEWAGGGRRGDEHGGVTRAEGRREQRASTDNAQYMYS